MKISSWGLPCGADVCVCVCARPGTHSLGPLVTAGSWQTRDGKPEELSLRCVGVPVDDTNSQPKEKFLRVYLSQSDDSC